MSASGRRRPPRSSEGRPPSEPTMKSASGAELEVIGADGWDTSRGPGRHPGKGDNLGDLAARVAPHESALILRGPLVARVTHRRVLAREHE